MCASRQLLECGYTDAFRRNFNSTLRYHAAFDHDQPCRRDASVLQDGAIGSIPPFGKAEILAPYGSTADLAKRDELVLTYQYSTYAGGRSINILVGFLLLKDIRLSAWACRSYIHH